MMGEIAGNVLLMAGSAWMLLAAIGVVRFRDTYQRLHASTKAVTLGLLLMLAGAAFYIPGADAAKLALTALFVFLTAPVGAQLIGRASARWGVEEVEVSSVNELLHPPSRE